MICGNCRLHHPDVTAAQVAACYGGRNHPEGVIRGGHYCPKRTLDRPCRNAVQPQPVAAAENVEAETPTFSSALRERVAAPAMPVEVREGYFTVVDGEGHLTLRFRRQPEDSAFKPGEVVVAFLSGSDNVSDYTQFAHVDGGRLRVWRRFDADGRQARAARALIDGGFDAAATLFDEVVESAPCLRCNRMLTVPASVANGYGPVCAEKVGAA